MKIALCTIGSRGDIEPFLIVGQYLQQNGFQVKVSSAEVYKSLASTYGVSYQAFKGDYELLLDDEALKQAIGNNPFTLGKSLKEKVYPIIENSLETFYELANWADIILYHPKTMIDGIGEEFQHKLIKAYVVPAFTPTVEFKNPIVSFLPFLRFLNKFSYVFFRLGIQLFNRPVKNFRKRFQLHQRKKLLKTPIVYGISPSFLKRPADYPYNAHFTGFWTKESNDSQLSEKLNDFLKGGKKILLITFGSMPYKSPIAINTFVKHILEKVNCKVIVVRGWGLKDAEIHENDSLIALESAPFSKLFNKVDCILHHGGAGTTALALKSGLPQFIVPVLHPFGDQYFWGKQVEKNKVGVTPVPLKNLSVSDLLNAVNQLMSDELMLNAKHLKADILQERGLHNLKSIIEQHFNEFGN